MYLCQHGVTLKYVSPIEIIIIGAQFKHMLNIGTVPLPFHSCLRSLLAGKANKRNPLLFAERWRHLTDSNEPNFINILSHFTYSNGNKVAIFLPDRIISTCMLFLLMYTFII